MHAHVMIDKPDPSIIKYTFFESPDSNFPLLYSLIKIRIF